MQTVRIWARRATTAAGASIVVPVAVMAAAALVALGGDGLRALGSLSQLVNGPQAPLADLAVSGTDTLAAEPGALLGGASGTSGGAAGADAGVGAGGGAVRIGGGGDDGSGGGGDRGTGTPGGGGGDGGSPVGGGDSDGGDGGDGEPRIGPIDPVDEIEEAGRDVSQQLPEPVGPLTGEVIDGVIDATQQLLPPGIEVNPPGS